MTHMKLSDIYIVSFALFADLFREDNVFFMLYKSNPCIYRIPLKGTTFTVFHYFCTSHKIYLLCTYLYDFLPKTWKYKHILKITPHL